MRTALGLCLSLCVARPVLAQAPQASAARREFGLSGTLLGPFSLGSASADLIRPSGGRLSIFSTDNSLGPGGGVEASLAFRLGTRWALAAAGNWSVTHFRSVISGDVEGVPDVTLSESVSRFGVTGSVVWTFRGRNRTAGFFRMGAGWMRELTGRRTSAGDGIVGNVGGGVKYWVRNPPRRQGRRVGFSVEALAVGRSGGVSRPSRTVRVAPALSAGLVMDF